MKTPNIFAINKINRQLGDWANGKHGQWITIAGVVICRQRPGTAKGHVFISVEDETGIANATVRSGLFEKLRLTITHEPLLESGETGTGPIIIDETGKLG